MMIRQARLTGCVALFAAMIGASGCAVDTSSAESERTAEADAELVYGTWGKLVSTSANRCLDVRGGSLGGIVQIYNCTGASNQMWTFANPNGPIFTRLNASYALSNNPSYNYLNVAPYNAGSAQMFAMRTAEFPSATGFCLGFAGPSSPLPNNSAQVSACSAWDAQSLAFDESLRPIKNRNGDCLTGGGVSGTQVYFAGCGTKPNQNWQLSSNGSIRQNGLCLDIRGGSGYPGAAVQLYNCHGGSNQSWSIKGQLALAATGECLMTPTTANQTQVELANCAYAPNATWQFKW